MARLICIGNYYRQDDALGLFIGKHPKIKSQSNIEVFENFGDAFALIEAWKEAETVIVVDAVKSGRAPGTIFRFNLLSDNLPPDIFTVSTHSSGIAECIAISRRLSMLPEKLIFYGIEGQLFGYGTEISDIVKEAMAQVVEQIMNDVG